LNQPPIVPAEVIIRDIDIPFRDLVRLLVKLVLAAIPAIFILAVIGFTLFLTFVAIFANLGAVGGLAH